MSLRGGRPSKVSGIHRRMVFHRGPGNAYWCNGEDIALAPESVFAGSRPRLRATAGGRSCRLSRHEQDLTDGTEVGTQKVTWRQPP